MIKRFSPPLFALILKQVVLFGALFLVACHDNTANKNAPTPTVNVVSIVNSTLPLKKQYIGITQSIASVAIRARVQGFLEKKNFIEGKPVKKGQLLYVIDPRPYEAQLNLAQGQLSRSIASKEYQEVEYLRLKQLVAKGDISKSNYDQSVSRLAETTADVQVQNAQVQNAQINLSYCFMYSPFDGIIGKKYVDVGNLVGGAENTLLAYVVQLNPVYVEFSPSVNDFTEFLTYRQNMPFKVEATMPQNDKMVFKGQVDLVNNQADTPTSTILMRATIDNPEQLLLPGIYVNLTLTIAPSHPVILVPAKAVIQVQGMYSVFVVGKDNKIVNKTVKVERQEKDQYIVTSGLQAGDLVIIDGLQKLRPGMTVKTQVIKD